MASLVIVPASGAFFPTTYRCCPYSDGFRYSPIRRRNQFPCRPNPPAYSLSRLFEEVERERELENLIAPALLFHLRERLSGDSEKEGNQNNTDKDKQPSDRTEEKESPKEEKTSDKFTVSVELGDAFEPSEISVKLVDRSLRIEGKHEEKGDDGHFSYRQFSRSYYVPEDVDIENLTSSLSKEGVLSVEAPRLQLKEKESEERNIPIEQTGSSLEQTTSPEAVEEKKSDETNDSIERESKEHVEAEEPKESQKDTSIEPEAAGASGEDTE